MKKCIILANGKPPTKKVVLFLLKHSYPVLFCADGGANTAMKMDLNPQYIIGDLDSITRKTLNYFSRKTKIIKLNSQDDTDVEKCLKSALKLKFDEAILIGVTGDRLDHTFCNLGIVLKFFDKIKIKILAENSILSALTGIQILKTIPGETISIYGIDSKAKISSRGLKYELRMTSLPFGFRESTSNVALTKVTELNIEDGIVFVIRDFHIMRKHGLL